MAVKREENVSIYFLMEIRKALPSIYIVVMALEKIISDGTMILRLELLKAFLQLAKTLAPPTTLLPSMVPSKII